MVMYALSTGCSSFAHHYNLLGEELAICARTAKADWIFHCIYLCGCGRVICLQKRTSGSKLKKVPTQSLTVLFLWEVFLACTSLSPKTDQNWGRGEKSREKTLEWRDKWRSTFKGFVSFESRPPSIGNFCCCWISRKPCQELSPWDFYPDFRTQVTKCLNKACSDEFSSVFYISEPGPELQVFLVLHT